MKEAQNTTDPGGSVANPLGRPVRGGGHGLRGVLVIGGLLVVGVVVFGLNLLVSNKEQSAGKATIAAVAVSSETAAGPKAPSVAVSPAYSALIEQQNADEVRAALAAVPDAAASGSTAVIPPLIGKNYEAQAASTDGFVEGTTYTVGTVTAANTDNYDGTRAQASIGAAAKVKADALKALFADRVLLPQTAARGVTFTNASAASGTSTVAAISGPQRSLPLFDVLAATVDVGANTDYPGQIIVRLGGQFHGMRLIGNLGSQTLNGPVDRVVFRFTQLLDGRNLYDIEGFAVDPKTRIPAIKGDINRHIVHNLVTEGAATFLLGFASGIGQQSFGGSSDGFVGGFNGGLSSRDLVAQQGATALSEQLSQYRFRNATVTLPVGSLVGVVITKLPTQPAVASSTAVGRQGGPQTASTSTSVPVDYAAVDPVTTATTVDGVTVTVGDR